MRILLVYNEFSTRLRRARFLLVVILFLICYLFSRHAGRSRRCAQKGRRLRVTPELQKRALAATEAPGGFKDFLSQDALVYAIEAEGLDRRLEQNRRQRASG